MDKRLGTITNAELQLALSNCIERNHALCERIELLERQLRDDRSMILEPNEARWNKEQFIGTGERQADQSHEGEEFAKGIIGRLGANRELPK